MVFKGFVQTLPEYEVITPQTKLKYTIRSLTTTEELKIKTSLVSNATFNSILNETLYNCLIKKPKEADTFENFCKHTTLIDRDALFTGWYHCSYGNIVENVPVICPHCENEFTINYDLSKNGELIEYPGKSKEILKEKEKVDFDYVAGFAILKVPTLDKEFSTGNDVLLQQQEDEIITYYLMIDEMWYFSPEDEKREHPIKIETTSDMIYAIKSLIPRDRKKIAKVFADKFSKYTLKLPYNAICTNPKCGKKIAGEVDLFRYFFREIYTG